MNNLTNIYYVRLDLRNMSVDPFDPFSGRVAFDQVTILQNYREYIDGVLKNQLKFEFHVYFFVSVNHSICMISINQKHLENDLQLLCKDTNALKLMNEEKLAIFLISVSCFLALSA